MFHYTIENGSYYFYGHNDKMEFMADQIAIVYSDSDGLYVLHKHGNTIKMREWFKKASEALPGEFKMIELEKGFPVSEINKMLSISGYVKNVVTNSHECLNSPHLYAVMSPANTMDWESHSSRQGYQVFRCNVCGKIWGKRYQWDSGTGEDDDWKCFGHIDPKDVVRHY